MNFTRLALSIALAGCAAAASAQTADSLSQRDINQETRIRNGLQDGSLNTREAALLQRREANLDRMQSRALRDGTLSDAERARLAGAEKRVSQDIYSARHNGVQGNPLSASSQRMQQAAQRDINQQQRIQNGIESGQLSNREVARLERGQARVDAKQFQAGRDGHVGAAETHSVNRAQNRQSERIRQMRHNDVKRAG